MPKPTRYHVRRAPRGGGYQVIDDYATNGYGQPWVEVPGTTKALAEANAARLNAWWEQHKRPCTCGEGDPDE
jgi:hypothetical protein